MGIRRWRGGTRPKRSEIGLRGRGRDRASTQLDLERSELAGGDPRKGAPARRRRARAESGGAAREWRLEKGDVQNPVGSESD